MPDAEITVQYLPLKVWVTMYTHEYGTDIAVFATEALAEKARQEIATEWWHDAFADHEMPVDLAERADMYFDAMCDSAYGPRVFRDHAT